MILGVHFQVLFSLCCYGYSCRRDEPEHGITEVNTDSLEFCQTSQQLRCSQETILQTSLQEVVVDSQYVVYRFNCLAGGVCKFVGT